VYAIQIVSAIYEEERVFFSGNREWVCGQAEGEVLELAAGTATNLPYYPAGVTLTAIELSPEMTALGRKRADDLGRELDHLAEAGFEVDEVKRSKAGFVELVSARKPA
jgi:hypothetical protein